MKNQAINADSFIKLCNEVKNTTFLYRIRINTWDVPYIVTL
ncbi:MAG: hypothetical protein JWP81_2604 [Ferruginibacter sp.]|nr:hypothetical protein [Ferruginibacter sp.]